MRTLTNPINRFIEIIRRWHRHARLRYTPTWRQADSRQCVRFGSIVHLPDVSQRLLRLQSSRLDLAVPIVACCLFHGSWTPGHGSDLSGTVDLAPRCGRRGGDRGDEGVVQRSRLRPAPERRCPSLLGCRRSSPDQEQEHPGDQAGAKRARLRVGGTAWVEAPSSPGRCQWTGFQSLHDATVLMASPSMLRQHRPRWRLPRYPPTIRGLPEPSKLGLPGSGGYRPGDGCRGDLSTAAILQTGAGVWSMRPDASSSA